MKHLTLCVAAVASVLAGGYILVVNRKGLTPELLRYGLGTIAFGFALALPAEFKQAVGTVAGGIATVATAMKGSKADA